MQLWRFRLLAWSGPRLFRALEVDSSNVGRLAPTAVRARVADDRVTSGRTGVCVDELRALRGLRAATEQAGSAHKLRGVPLTRFAEDSQADLWRSPVVPAGSRGRVVQVEQVAAG